MEVFALHATMLKLRDCAVCRSMDIIVDYDSGEMVKEHAYKASHWPVGALIVKRQGEEHPLRSSETGGRLGCSVQRCRCQPP